MLHGTEGGDGVDEQALGVAAADLSHRIERIQHAGTGLAVHDHHVSDRRIRDDCLLELLRGGRREGRVRITACGVPEMRCDLDQPVAVDAVGVDQQLAAGGTSCAITPSFA